jgi:D-glycero-D-manno-heptose 1,7-bisphosphate phosphatase
MNKAIFLDRDGVINEDFGYVCKIKDFCFIDGVFDFCKIAQIKGYLLIVITNQAGIAKGYYTEQDYNKLTDYMLNKFEEQSINISKIYHCSELNSYNRKPNPGMLLQAKDEFNINLTDSILIGDKNSDIEAGINAGIANLFFLNGKYEYKSEANVIICNNWDEIRENFLHLTIGL